MWNRETEAEPQRSAGHRARAVLAALVIVCGCTRQGSDDAHDSRPATVPIEAEATPEGSSVFGDGIPSQRELEWCRNAMRIAPPGHPGAALFPLTRGGQRARASLLGDFEKLVTRDAQVVGYLTEECYLAGRDGARWPSKSKNGRHTDASLIGAWFATGEDGFRDAVKEWVGTGDTIACSHALRKLAWIAFVHDDLELAHCLASCISLFKTEDRRHLLGLDWTRVWVGGRRGERVLGGDEDELAHRLIFWGGFHLWARCASYDQAWQAPWQDLLAGMSGGSSPESQGVRMLKGVVSNILFARDDERGEKGMLTPTADSEGAVAHADAIDKSQGREARAWFEFVRWGVQWTGAFEPQVREQIAARLLPFVRADLIGALDVEPAGYASASDAKAIDREVLYRRLDAGDVTFVQELGSSAVGSFSRERGGAIFPLTRVFELRPKGLMQGHEIVILRATLGEGGRVDEVRSSLVSVGHLPDSVVGLAHELRWHRLGPAAVFELRNKVAPDDERAILVNANGW
ncbi:MAG: hypothetical protein R3C29_17890 [Dehalococcoidia bacterium]